MAEATKFRFVLAPAIRPYQRQWLRADILAGLAAGAVVIPQAMAYATVADMPVQFGLSLALAEKRASNLEKRDRSVLVSGPSSLVRGVVALIVQG